MTKIFYKLYLRLSEKYVILSSDERKYVQNVITKRKPHEWLLVGFSIPLKVA